MPIFVNSPYSGRPVKVRDQDISRALRDEEGRVFYAVPVSEGEGYYGSPTRHGSPKDEARAAELKTKMTQAKESGAEQSAQQIHDTTGSRRRSPMKLLILLLVIVAIVVGAYYFLIKTPQGASLEQNLRDLAAPKVSQAPETPETPETFTPRIIPVAEALPWVTTASGLRYRIDEPGHGRVATAGQFVRIEYTASSMEGAIFDRSEEGYPIGFVLWSGQVIRGWDEGIAGMREGELRTLIVPPHLVTSDLAGRDDPTLPDVHLQFQIGLLEALPGITYDITRPGEGPIARPGDAVEMHYISFIANHDQPYDNSYDRNQPLRFRIGQGEVIVGWELGIAGMAAGEKRVLTIPPYLAYGSRGAGNLIPPHATLRCEVELLRIIPQDHAETALSQRTLPGHS